MARVTFSRYFPAYHPRAGEPTYFVEKMIQWYWDNISDVLQGYHNVPTMLHALNLSKFPEAFYQEFSDNLNPEINEWKSHTIRAGHRLKAGDFIQPCVWTGKPYRSLQMQFLPALLIPKVWDLCSTDGSFWFGRFKEPLEIVSDREELDFVERITVASNDGLSEEDFKAWFPNDFDGQIICWNENIEY